MCSHMSISTQEIYIHVFVDECMYVQKCESVFTYVDVRVVAKEYIAKWAFIFSSKRMFVLLNCGLHF